MSGSGMVGGGTGGWEDALGTRNELSGTVLGPSVQARDIHGGVHVHTAPRQPVVPRSLLPPPAHFTNRRRELVELDRLLAGRRDGATPTVVVLSGPGGVGKTAVALYWLHRVRDRFGDGELYADLGGFGTAGAVAPGEVLGRFLRALGVEPAYVPVELEEQAALFRSLTAGRRMVILLDNAFTAAQVRPLLPGSEHSVVVVTSRFPLRRLVAEVGARSVRLDPLEPDASVELLARVLGDERVMAEPASANALARLCEGLPIALCVAGAKLASRPRWPVARVVRELTDERRRLATLSTEEGLSVQAVFDVSYRELPPGAARLYRLLGLHPGPEFGVGVAAAVLEETDEEAERLLEMLCGASLLQEADADRYRFHDLVRLHARELAEQVDTAAERDAALDRMLDWYLRAAVAADLVVMPLRWRLGDQYERARQAPPAYGSPAEALAWLESERVNLLAAVRSAYERGQDTTVWQLCEALWGLYFVRKHYRDWIEAHELGAAAAQRCADPRAEGRMRCQLGLALVELNRLTEAIEQFTRALEADRSVGHRRGEEAALQTLGLAYLRLDRFDEATDCFTQALAVAEELGDPRAIALNWHHRGRALSGSGRHEEALAHLRHARELMAALPDPYNEARVLTSLGQAYVRAGRLADAVEPLQQALATMREQGARFQEAQVAEALGDVAERAGDRAGARRHFEQALAVYQELDSPQAAGVQARLEALGRPTALRSDQPGEPRPRSGA